MIRLAQVTDIEYIVQEMLALRQHTTWASHPSNGYTVDSLTPFVSFKLLDPGSVVYVYDGPSGVVAFCGATLGVFQLPPHMPCVFEWGWSGSKREAVQCWQAVKSWGKLRGAELAYRVLGRPTQSTKKFREVATWEVL